MEKRGVWVLILLLSIEFVAAASTSSSNYNAQIIVPGGGGKTNTDLYSLQAVIGQPIIGKTNTSLYNAWIGFFYGRYYKINNPPLVPTLLAPPDNSRLIGNLANLTYIATDPEGDPLIYYVYGDSSPSPGEPTIYTGSEKYYEWTTTDGTTYYWRVKAYDGQVTSDYSSEWSFRENAKPTHDTPVITPLSPNTNNNLTCTPQNGADADSDTIYYVHNWLRNSVSLARLNMPFGYNSSIKSRTERDYSSYENNGTLYGAKWTGSGKMGGAYTFNGNAYIDCGAVTTIGSELTIEAWVKDSGTSNGTVAGKYETVGKRWGIYVDSIDTGKIYWVIGGENYATSSTASIGTNWHHLAMVYNGTKSDNENRLKAYLDGASITLDYVGTIPASMPAVTGTVQIGRHSTNRYFNGIIDEVKIYNISLTKEQVYTDWNHISTTSGISANETEKDETWTCEVTPVDGYEAGLTKSVSVFVGNNPPNKVVLVSPANDSISYNRSQMFNWSVALDPDGDFVTYNIAISKTSDFLTSVYNTSLIAPTNFTPDSWLDVDTVYWWKVRAYDGSLYGEYSDVWNVTIASLKSIKLIVNQTNFKVLKPGESNDTTDDSPPPMRVQNNGNVAFNVTILANESLFRNAPLNRKNFQVKTAEYEVGAYDAAKSRTTWLNLTDTAQNLIAGLEWNASKDEAKVDIRVEVPLGEPALPLRSKLTLEAK